MEPTTADTQIYESAGKTAGNSKPAGQQQAPTGEACETKELYNSQMREEGTWVLSWAQDMEEETQGQVENREGEKDAEANNKDASRRDNGKEGYQEDRNGSPKRKKKLKTE
jgi:hypothetical protein